jgi:hypothetical protein
MNNPLLFTDPSGYRPEALFEEEGRLRSSGGGGGGWNPFGWIKHWGHATGISHSADPYGGWSYNWSTGKYERYTGEKMSATDFFYNTPYLSSSRYVRQPTEDETKNAYSSLTGTSVEYLPGSDPLGSKMAIFTHENGKVSAGPVSFWKITGSYYNHLYYFSGLAAYSPNEAFRFAKNSGSIDWGGVTNATLLMAGGVAEMVAGGVVEFFSAGISTPLTVPMMVDGAGRTVANAQRLAMYLKGNSKLADAYPTNLGAAIGKFGDLASGVCMDQVGNYQAISGTVNDFTSFVATGGSGFALKRALMNPTPGNFANYGYVFWNYNHSMYGNAANINY